MKLRALLVLLTALCSTACGSGEADAVCDKLQKCNKFNFTSMDDCVDAIEQQTDEPRQACISCMDVQDCVTLEDDACTEECPFVL